MTTFRLLRKAAANILDTTIGITCELLTIRRDTRDEWGGVVRDVIPTDVLESQDNGCGNWWMRVRSANSREAARLVHGITVPGHMIVISSEGDHTFLIHTEPM